MCAVIFSLADVGDVNEMAKGLLNKVQHPGDLVLMSETIKEKRNKFIQLKGGEEKGGFQG